MSVKKSVYTHWIIPFSVKIIEVQGLLQVNIIPSVFGNLLKGLNVLVKLMFCLHATVSFSLYGIVWGKHLRKFNKKGTAANIDELFIVYFNRLCTCLFEPNKLLLTDILGYIRTHIIVISNRTINCTVNYIEMEGLNKLLGKFNSKWQQTFLGVNMNIFNVRNTHERFA